MTDQRRAPRRRCLIGAKVMLAEQASAINCVVRSLSETGAKIEFESVQLLPKTFTLRLDTGVEYAVTSIAWQKDRQLGVVFSPTSAASDETAFAHNRLRNAAAFREEISTQAPAEPQPAPADPLATGRSAAAQPDFALAYRKRMAQSLRKPS